MPSYDSPLSDSADDAILAERLAAGDARAFEELYRRYAPALRRFATRLVGASLADDAVHEALASTHNALLGSGRAVTLRPWLFRCVRNACVSELRRRERDVELHERAHRPAPDAFEVLTRSTDTAAIVRGISQLPARQREALVMRALDGVPYEDVAAHFALTRNAAVQLVHRARQGVAIHFAAAQ